MNIFKNILGSDPRDERPNLTKIETAPLVNKTEYQIIEEIHHSIDIAQDLLLKQALDVLETHKLPDEQVKKAETLRRLGFRSTEEVEKLNEIDRKADFSRTLSENILHYKKRYPFLKFLTMEELDRICTKYGLLHSEVYNYIGNVPDKNLLEITNAQPLDPSDYRHRGNPGEFKNRKTGALRAFHFMWEIYISKPEIIDAIENPEDWEYVQGQNWPSPARPDTLKIAAPEAMFRKSANLVREGNALVQKDPIVFRLVRGGIQVLTKWGLEANDSALINPINN